MRILLVTHRYPPWGVAGVERLSEQTALALQRSDHEVTVLTRHTAAAPPVPTLQRTTRDGVRVMSITGGGPTLGMFPRLTPVLERLFEQTLVEVNPDVVLISHLISHSPAYVSIAHRWGVPVVAELHDFYYACERAHLDRPSGQLCGGPQAGRACATHCFPNDRRGTERWALRTHMYRWALQQADALTCPSEFVANYFRDNYGPGIPPLHVIGNGVDFAERERTPRGAVEDQPLHLACVGVVAAHKGIHIVLEALRIAHLPRARLSLFGEVHPPYFRGLARLAEGLPAIEFKAYGAFKPSELPFLLGDVDAIIIPSLVWETYSIVAREAMACGIPVIASRIGALPEAVRDGDNGLLFEPGSAIDLANHLVMIDHDRARLAQLGTGIRRTDWTSVQERLAGLETLLTSVVAAGTGANRGSADLEELAILRDSFL